MEFNFEIKLTDIITFIACCSAAYSWYEGNRLHDNDFSSIDAVYHIAEACFMILVVIALRRG